MKQKTTSEQKFEIVNAYIKGEKVSKLSVDYNIPRSTIYSYIKSHKSKLKSQSKEISAKELHEINFNLTKSQNIISILKSVDVLPTSPLSDKLIALENLYGTYDNHTLCEALDVNRSTFLNHIFRNKNQDTVYKKRHDELCKLITDVFNESCQIYGAVKVHAVLKDRGGKVSINTVRKIMNELDLHSITVNSKKEYKRLQNAKKTDKLKFNFKVSNPNEVWVSDATSFIIKDRPLHICAILDLYSRKIISYKISHKNTANLVSATLNIAYNEHLPIQLLTFHSDRGIQYTSLSFKKLLHELNIEQSFSPKASPRNNAVMESFFAILKKEEIYRTNYKSEAHFKRSIQQYIDFYNNIRPHKACQNRSPKNFEKAYFDRNSK